MIDYRSSADDERWLARPLKEALQHYRGTGGRIVSIKLIRAPKKDQGPDGTWRVVRVQGSPEGIVLTAAWQPPANVLGFGTELG